MDSVRMQIASKLKSFRKEAGLNVDQVGAKLGKSGKTISAWEVGRGQPDGDQLIILCRLFGKKISDFYGIEPDVSSSSFCDVPIYGDIAAGTPIEMIESEGTFPIPAAKHEQYPDAFLLRVEGESMNRILPNGCYALIDPCEDVERDNQPYAVCVNGFDATIKRVRKLNNGFELVPDSTDPTFKPTVYDYGVEGTETITPIGRVVYYVLPFDWDF